MIVYKLHNTKHITQLKFQIWIPKKGYTKEERKVEKKTETVKDADNEIETETEAETET